MSQQVSLLRKRLNSAIITQKELEDTCKIQVNDLTQFIAKLSLVCKGVDIELDNRLAKYRKTIQKGVNYEQLKPLLEEIADLTKSYAVRAEANFNSLYRSAEDAGKKLQKRQGLPDDLRRNLRLLINDDLSNVKTHNDFIPVLERLINLYNRVLDKQTNPAATDYKTDNEEYVQEIQSLLSEISFDGSQALEIDSIKERLIHHLEPSDLVDCCVAIIRIIIHSISQERISAQQFLFSINETLSLLQGNFTQTLKRSSSLNTQITQLNRQINEKIQVINFDVAAENDIDKLKELITKKMESLSGDLSIKEKVEQKENLELVKMVKKMATRVKELESKTEQYQEKLAEQRFKNLQDNLTLLPNRSAFDERYTLEYNKFQRQHNDICIVIADIDHFKKINDNFGHSAGDRTLKAIAKALKSSIRVTDFIARYGGEEFVLIMPHSRLEQIKTPLEKMRKSVKALPFKFKNQSISVSISFGATQLIKGDSLLGAFDRADDALYEAKKQGRNRVIIKK